jgi:4-methyl-5(b-hydroxyethyl)-thiazole monophosphate biosynthesis
MVYILLGNGFETIEALAPCDVLRRSGVQVHLVSVSDELTVMSGQGVHITADCRLEDVRLDKMDMLVLPGGLGGVREIMSNQNAQVLIQRASEEGKWIGAICAAPTMLAQLGLLDRRHCVVYPGMEEQMFSAVVLKGRQVVQDSRFITAEAAGSSIHFGLKLVEVLRGAEASQEVSQAIHFHG